MTLVCFDLHTHSLGESRYGPNGTPAPLDMGGAIAGEPRLAAAPSRPAASAIITWMEY